MAGTPFASLADALRDRYVLEHELGHGGMATVYLARDLRHRRAVAVKVLHPELAHALGPERFLREIETVANLQHPHIMPLFDSGEAGGLLYYVMPCAEGESLRARLTREKQLRIDEALEIARQVASALAYAHSRGIVHRDVKPENILFEGDQAVVADFGIASALQALGGERLTGTGLAIGTPAYMSPEQAGGEHDLDGRSDQYSLGCVVYEMLTGAPPFAGRSAQAIMARHAVDPVPSLRTVRPTVSRAIDDTIARVLAKVPADRFANAQEFATALSQAASLEPSGPARARSAQPRWRRLALLATAVLLAVGSAAVLARVGDDAVAVAEEAERIAVLPFHASGPGVEVLGEGMVDLLTTNLQGVGGIQALDPRLVLKRWGRQRREESGGVQEALDFGRDLDAGSVVTGSAVSVGGHVRLAADLYAVPGGERLARAQVDGPADSILPLVDRLSMALLRDVWRSREPVPSLDLSSLTTDSIAALRAYLQGERYYRRFALDSALAQYTRAVEVDSTFALAHLRRALVYGWTGGYGSPASVDAANAAFRYAERLPPRSRRLLEGYQAFQEGSTEAIDLMRGYVEEFPAVLEGWYFYAEALYHLVEIEPSSPDTAIAAFDRVVAGDPTSMPAIVHALEIAMVYRDSARYGRYLRVFARTAPRARVAAHRTGAELVWGPPPSDSAIRSAMASWPHLGLYAVAAAFRNETATSDSILDLRRRLFAALPANSPLQSFAALPANSPLQSFEPVDRGFMLIGFGRLREARALVDTVAAISPGAAEGLLGWPVALGLVSTDYGGANVDSLVPQNKANDQDRQTPAYVDVVRAVALGRPDEGIKLATEAIQEPIATSDSTSSRGLLRAAMGWARLVRGDTTAGIADLRTGLAVTGARPAGSAAFLRFQLALALSADSRTREEGISHLRYGFNGAGIHLMPLTYLALGRTYEAAGKTDSAAVAYGRFLGLWDKADPELQGRVAEARKALAHLTSEPR